MFSGRYPNNIDSKGRVSFPSRFREVLSESGDDRIILTNHLNDQLPCLEAWPLSRWKEILAKALFYEGLYAQAFPTFGAERRGAPVAAFVRLLEEMADREERGPGGAKPEAAPADLIPVIGTTAAGVARFWREFGPGERDVTTIDQRVREVLERTRHKERRSQWRRALLDQLEEDLDINQLPASLVRSGLREDLERYAYMMAMQGKDPQNEDVDWQELSARMEPEVRKRVLDDLVLEQLADRWGMEVPEDDVRAYVEGDAREKGVPVAEHLANLAKEGQLDGIRHAARISATVDELIRRVGGEVE